MIFRFRKRVFLVGESRALSEGKREEITFLRQRDTSCTQCEPNMLSVAGTESAQLMSVNPCEPWRSIGFAQLTGYRMQLPLGPSSPPGTSFP